MPDSLLDGRVAERTNALALKARGLIAPGVRIPSLPPVIFNGQRSSRTNGVPSARGAPSAFTLLGLLSATRATSVAT